MWDFSDRAKLLRAECFPTIDAESGVSIVQHYAQK
jgi:hypothetical protein